MQSRRWFHPNLAGTDAERLLLERGAHGSYLVRPSKSNPGDFTLSVRRNDHITHIKIQNTGDYYDLYGGEKFATLSELVQYYTENLGQLKELGGGVIDLKFPQLSEEVTQERWYHGYISGVEASTLLMEKGQDGSYLVRASTSQPGDYVLNARCEDRVTHIMIHTKGEKFDVGGGIRFDTLSELVDYYKKNPMVETTGSVVHLRQPFNATKFSFSAIGSRYEELNQLNDEGGIKSGFFFEFEQLQQQETKHLFSRKEGARPENKTKNRFKNILPFDHTRVLLTDGDSDAVGSDYINANLISGEEMNIRKHYIATQGCVPATVVDFWRMVWQQNTRVIVMVTNEVERGRNKCTRYWPDLDSSRTIGKFILRNRKETPHTDYLHREFEIHLQNDSSSTRTIYHYQFRAWPDHGVPQQPGVVLGFLQTINTKQAELKDGSGPMVVHCSAGIGRTGTIIVIDLLVHLVEKYGIDCDVDIQKTTQLVRSQRSGMVQTEAQYKFVYSAVKHHIDTLRMRIQAEKQVQDSSAVYTNLSYSSGSGSAGAAGASPAQVVPSASSRLPTGKSPVRQSSQDQSRVYHNVGPFRDQLSQKDDKPPPLAPRNF